MNKFKRLLSCGLAAAMVLGMTACTDEGPAVSTSKPSGGVGGVGNVGEQAAATSMVTAATDGAKYAEENGTDKFVDWFAAQAQAYSDNMNAVQDMVAGKSAIVVVAYYQNGLMDFEVYSTEADPRND